MNEAAAKMAGQWWAEQLLDDHASAEKRAAIAAAVEARVLIEFSGTAYWDWLGERKELDGTPRESVFIECDYEPKGLLADAVAEVFGDELKPHQMFTSCQNLFARKTALTVLPNELRPKEGYGNWTRRIAVPGQTDGGE